MVKALFDTCIVIDYLNGISNSEIEFNLYQDKAISLITWMELMVGEEKHKTTSSLEDWLKQEFIIIDINHKISKKAVEIRKESRVKFPDAIIKATAIQMNRLLVTRNTKDFSKSDPNIRVPYEL